MIYLDFVCPASHKAIYCRTMLIEAQSCTSDDDCGYGRKCCSDDCFHERICKIGFYVNVKPQNITTTTTTMPNYDIEEITAA